MTLCRSLTGLLLVGLLLAVGAPRAGGQQAGAPPEADEAEADAKLSLAEEGSAALAEAERESAESAGETAEYAHDGDDPRVADNGHAKHGGHEAAREPNPLAIDPDLAIWTAVVFVILLLVLSKFAWGPIMTALEHREKTVADHITSAADKHEQAKEMLVDYEKKLANAANEVREMLEEARRDAEHTKGEILAEAKAAAQAEHERAMRDVRNATDAALKQIGETGANFAIELAGKIVQKELTAEDHTRLIREAVSNFPSRN